MLELRYGFEEDAMSRAAVSSEIGISREQVRQIEAHAITCLRASGRAAALKET